jgi:aminoglycoside phosphotransferase (APT) family kinase protein
MKLPDPTPTSEEQLAAIAARHGIRFQQARPVEQSGIINSVYFLDDDLVLRIPRNHPTHVIHARREAIAIPAAIAAGVRTARLVAFDERCDIVPVPYLIVERVRGVNLESFEPEPIAMPGVWRELGRDLARLHTGAGPATLSSLSPGIDFDFTDPRLMAEQLAVDGWISPTEVRWLLLWLEGLAPAAARPVKTRFVHADVQMSNIMVDPQSRRFRALIDWGCAGLGDAAGLDFVPMPLAAVPLLLAGHREVAPLDDDDSAEARILWWRLRMLLSVMPRGAARGMSWGERPIAWLFDLARFFSEPPNDRWRAIAPSSFVGGAKFEV